MRAILAIVTLTITILVVAPSTGFAEPISSEGAALFNLHCAGCHPHGNNIIRRSRTLKLAALERRGLDNPEAIAAVASDGIGQMSGYGDVLGAEGVQQVSEWIWQQAQNAWIQG